MEIRVNGVTYTSWEEVPAELRDVLRRYLPDADRNNVPDVFEGARPPEGRTVFRSAKFTVGGREYNSIEDLPPYIREQLEAGGMLPAGMQQPITQPGPRPAGEAGIVLDGAPMSAAEGTGELPRKKHWWRRGG